MKIRDRLGISKKRQRQFIRVMQLLLFAAVLGGLYTGDTGIIVNSAVCLLISFVPAFLERDHEIVMDPALVLWMTSAVFFHAVGTYGPYGTIWWWDHFTHMLSSSVVGGAGYATVMALENHREDIHFPKKFIFVFLLIFVMAFGVLWEVLEFLISEIARMSGGETILTQYGLEDTMKDLVFDMFGAVMVALFGEAHLSGLADQIRERF